MNKLLSVIFIILQSAFLANCKGCHEAPPRTSAEDNISEWPEKIETDTIEPKQEIEEKKESAPSSRSTRSSIRRYNNDNMRGFDPASEDDMDDNGMSRYMENNDEEGWD